MWPCQCPPYLTHLSSSHPGTTIGVSPYLVHRNPAVYPNPGKFDPDRWLTGEPIANIDYLTFGMSQYSRQNVNQWDSAARTPVHWVEVVAPGTIYAIDKVVAFGLIDSSGAESQSRELAP